MWILWIQCQCHLSYEKNKNLLLSIESWLVFFGILLLAKIKFPISLGRISSPIQPKQPRGPFFHCSCLFLVVTPSFFISIAWIKSRNIVDGCYREPWITPQGILHGDKSSWLNLQNDAASPPFWDMKWRLTSTCLANLCHSHSHTALRPIQQQSHRAIDRSGRL